MTEALVLIAVGLVAVAISAMITFDTIVNHHSKRGAFGEDFTRRREGRGGRDTSND